MNEKSFNHQKQDICWVNKRGIIMNIKNNRRKKESMKRIEHTFAELLQSNEISEISITDICKGAKVNRSTFYANYLDIFDLVDKLKERMMSDFAELYTEEVENKYNSNNYLKLFYHIRDNQIFYRTYFKLQLDNFDLKLLPYDIKYVKTHYNNEHIEYHMNFFKAGMTAIIKMWLDNHCDVSPEELFEIIKSEYKNKPQIDVK